MAATGHGWCCRREPSGRRKVTDFSRFSPRLGISVSAPWEGLYAPTANGHTTTGHKAPPTASKCWPAERGRKKPRCVRRYIFRTISVYSLGLAVQRFAYEPSFAFRASADKPPRFPRPLFVVHRRGPLSPLESVS